MREGLKRFSQLGDFQPGSISNVTRRCGKPNCHCAKPSDPGHGPHRQLTQKMDGKTVTQTLSSPEAVRKAEKEIAEFRRFQKLSHELIEINQKICRLRTLTTQQLSPEKKNGPPHPTGNHPRTRTSLAAHFFRKGQDRSSGFGSHRDGHAFGHAPSRSGGTYRTAEI